MKVPKLTVWRAIFAAILLSGLYATYLRIFKGLGGSTPQAFQASKAEQDRLAARLWNGGAGRGNWVCASLVDG